MNFAIIASKIHQTNTIFLSQVSPWQFNNLSFYLLLFLLQFSSLHFPSLAYDPQDIYFINCGSDIDIKENKNLYIGESNRNYPKTSFSSKNSYTETNQSSVPSPLYQTSRIFHSESSYEFTTIPNNTYMVFLLQNFDANNTRNPGLIKEYFAKIIRKRFKITFTPLTSSFAFVNAIELFMLPVYLIPDSVTRFTYTSSTGQALFPYGGDLLSRALETKHRLNVGGENVSRQTDNLSREWLPDDSYITDPQNAKNSTYFGGTIKRKADDESDGPYSNKYTAPDVVYQTSKERVNTVLTV